MIKRLIDDRRREELRKEGKRKKLKKLVEKELWELAMQRLKEKGLV